MADKVRPITPTDVGAAKIAGIPDEVFEAFNELIAKNFHSGRSVVRQKEAELLACSKIGCTSQELYDNHWMDVEAAYRDAGWLVEYDKPGFNESYHATYTFIGGKKCSSGFIHRTTD